MKITVTHISISYAGDKYIYIYIYIYIYKYIYLYMYIKNCTAECACTTNKVSTSV